MLLEDGFTFFSVNFQDFRGIQWFTFLKGIVFIFTNKNLRSPL